MFRSARLALALEGRETRVAARSAGREDLDLRPAMRWLVRVSQVREVPAGETVGYGRTWMAPVAINAAMPSRTITMVAICSTATAILVNRKADPHITVRAIRLSQSASSPWADLTLTSGAERRRQRALC